jgi:hypothetical protein
MAISVCIAPPFYAINLLYKCLHRWLSLVTVILGVSLVGFSGSLVKDVLKENIASLPHIRATDTPEATKVVVGKFFLQILR